MSEMRDILNDTVTRLFSDLVTRETLGAAESGAKVPAEGAAEVLKC